MSHSCPRIKRNILCRLTTKYIFICAWFFDFRVHVWAVIVILSKILCLVVDFPWKTILLVLVFIMFCEIYVFFIMHYFAVIFHEIRKMSYSVQFMTWKVDYYSCFNLDTVYKRHKKYCRWLWLHFEPWNAWCIARVWDTEHNFAITYSEEVHKSPVPVCPRWRYGDT